MQNQKKKTQANYGEPWQADKSALLAGGRLNTAASLKGAFYLQHQSALCVTQGCAGTAWPERGSDTGGKAGPRITIT